MLIEFITAQRGELVSRANAKGRARLALSPTRRLLSSSAPLFLDHLAKALQLAPALAAALQVRGARARGGLLLDSGYTVAEVVQDWGDVCQAITELAESTGTALLAGEVEVLCLCLNNAVAGAITEYARVREQRMAKSEIERAGAFGKELREQVSAAHLGFQAIKHGRAPIGGSVAAVVAKSLSSLLAAIDRTPLAAQPAGGAHRRRVHVKKLIDDAEVDAAAEARVHGVSLVVTPAERGVDVNADPQLLAGAIANLMQNAFKFTAAGGLVLLTAAVRGAIVAIEIQDECGGLPAAKLEELTAALAAHGAARTALGSGLFASLKAIEASDGVVRVRDIPGSGCAFTIELPLLPGLG